MVLSLGSKSSRVQALWYPHISICFILKEKFVTFMTSKYNFQSLTGFYNGFLWEALPSLSSPLGNDGKGFKLEQILIFASSFAMECMINPEYLLPNIFFIFFTKPQFEAWTVVFYCSSDDRRYMQSNTQYSIRGWAHRSIGSSGDRNPIMSRGATS